MDKVANALNFIEPSALQDYFLSKQALDGPHFSLAKLVQSKSALEKIGENFIQEYHEIPANYPSKSTILSVASQVK